VSELKSLTVGVIGLGQIGGSIASAIRGRDLCGKVIGCETDEGLASSALDRSIVNELAESIDELTARSDVVVLAVHIQGILEIIERHADALRSKRLVFDTGSLKTSIVRTAKERGLPNIVAGHPLAGTEKRGAEAWQPDLFQGANYFYVPVDETSSEASALFGQIIEGIGGVPIKVDPEMHDRIFATTSNLPHLFAFLLAGIFDRMRNGSTDKEQFVCPSFYGATRVAASDPEMVFQMLWYNRENLTDSLDYLLDTLGKVREIMECKDGTRFRELFDVIK